MSFSSIQNLLDSSFIFLKNQVIPSLSDQQKRIAVIACAMFSLLAMSLLIYWKCFQRKKIDLDHVSVDQLYSLYQHQFEDPAKAPAEHLESMPTSLFFSSKIVEREEQKRKEEAAIKIQALYRGHLARRLVVKKEDRIEESSVSTTTQSTSNSVIQEQNESLESLFDPELTRINLSESAEDKREVVSESLITPMLSPPLFSERALKEKQKQKEEASIKIQAFYRRHLARRLSVRKKDRSEETCVSTTKQSASNFVVQEQGDSKESPLDLESAENKKQVVSESPTIPVLSLPLLSEARLKEEQKQKEEKASIKIQALYRGYLSRIKTKARMISAIETKKTLENIQVIVDKYDEPFQDHLALIKEKREIATIKIQAACFRFLNKQEKKHLLNYLLFEKARPYLLSNEQRQNLPRASCGKTPVYFLPDLSLVLKECGAPKSKIRFEQIKQARDICDANHYSRLMIPKARVHENFLVEQCLPLIEGSRLKEIIGIYLENIDCFTQAVEEFTDFFCQVSFEDTTGGSSHPFSLLSQVPLARYDNVAIYVENGQGKIGLIDLEGFESEYDTSQKERCFLKCKEIIRLFPCHLDNIICAAKKFDPDTELYRADLEKERDLVLDYFTKVYKNHLNFLKTHHIDSKNPSQIREIKPAEQLPLQTFVNTCIFRQHTSRYGEIKPLGKNPVENLKHFSQVFPEILNILFKQLIGGSLNKNLETYKINSASPYPTLLLARSLIIPYECDYYKSIQCLIASKLTMFTFSSPEQKSLFVSQLIDTVLKQLEQLKIISFYHNQFKGNRYLEV